YVKNNEVTLEWTGWRFFQKTPPSETPSGGTSSS
ncbi:MAG: hypothetical protein ACI9FZ_001101, partial [Bacteroidia bacterium]